MACFFVPTVPFKLGINLQNKLQHKVPEKKAGLHGDSTLKIVQNLKQDKACYSQIESILTIKQWGSIKWIYQWNLLYQSR